MNINYAYHVEYNGIWQCYETSEMLREESPLVPLTSPSFTADWDGVSPTLNVKTGTKPSGGIPFMGWPQN